MALLHYRNLGVHRPDVLMQRAFYGLKTFYDFLRRTKDYTESDAAVKRLAWAPGPGPDDDDDGERPAGYWVQLTEPADRPNEPESTFRDFLDENVSELYEAATPSEDANAQRPSRLDFGRARRIEVLDRDPETYQLLLERPPQEPGLLLRPNTWPLRCQIQALQTLQNSPSSEHLPLLRLFESVGHADWPAVWPADAALDQWMVLTDHRRPGTDEQRRFVQLALATPDFAFLEGPPGSGKTTAICELVLQLAREGKRALLCASTHVAVDNVLERLMDERNAHRDLVIPIRIGDRRNVSEKARPWQLERFVRTERERLLRELRRERAPSSSQRAMLSVLQHGPSVVERLVLDAANLVCGTTIGILQHPDIKAGGHGTPSFDVLIVDEASKTTFQEFLVPALLAKRWIIVGDPKQLSPYVDDDAMAINVASCLPSSEVQAACVDTFIAGHHSRGKQRTTVSAVTAKGLTAYLAQAEARGVALATPADDSLHLAMSPLIAGELESLADRAEDMPLDVAIVRAPDGALPGLRRRADAWNRLQRRRREEEPSWSGEIGWRLARLYEQRFADAAYTGGRKTTAQRLREQVEELLPDDSTGVDKEGVWREIDRVRRVALPSVLESLRHGFERDPRQRQGTALSEGLPDRALDQRHVLLSTQHRMHGDIAAFSHDHIYEGQALHTPVYLAEQRDWSYARYAHRALWLDVRGRFNRKFNANQREAEAVVAELQHFDRWARRNPRGDGHPWEVAVLTFYRGQEREVRQHLRRWTENHRAMRHFRRGGKTPYLTIELCTIDRFQGHEADLVLISVASPHPTSFLESPNRLNVALTRARFQRVVIGNRTGMYDARALESGATQRSVLAELAATEAWDSVEVRS
ncbi:MAG: DEAD/DEAH box helicase [Myxococcales bacterium]|nr:DEAD/DEAH box helicase [Myxococcales bacterium]